MKTNASSAGVKKKSQWSWKTDIPLVTLITLALLAMPRVVMHDLRVVPFDSGWYVAAALLPWVVYFTFAVFRKNKRPFYDFVVLGLLYGIFLALTHQLLWVAVWGDKPPEIGGNLKDTFSPFAEGIILRSFAVLSGVLTGLWMGVIFAVLATVVQKIRDGFEKK